MLFLFTNLRAIEVLSGGGGELKIYYLFYILRLLTYAFDAPQLIFFGGAFENG